MSVDTLLAILFFGLVGALLSPWWPTLPPERESPAPAETAKARLLAVIERDREAQAQRDVEELAQRARLATFGEALSIAFGGLIPLPPRHFEDGYWVATGDWTLRTPGTLDWRPHYRWRFR